MNERERGVFEILLVDDDPADRKLARSAFMKANGAVRLCEASSAEDALSMLYGRVRRDAVDPMPDLVIVDLDMPGMSGLDFLRLVKDDSCLSKIPVIVMSGSENEDDIAYSYELHVNAYIAKPAGISEFDRIIGALVEFWLHACKPPPKTYGRDRRT